MSAHLRRPSAARWLITPSLGAVIVLGVVIAWLVCNGHVGWALILPLPLGWALARWLTRVAAYVNPMWFGQDWLKRQGWTLEVVLDKRFRDLDPKPKP